MTMTTNLTDIDGVGPSYADELEEEGYDSAEDVADADPEALDDIVPTASGETIVAAAQDEVAIGDEEDEVEDEPEAEEDADAKYEDSEEEVYELSPGFSEDQEHHLITALVNEEVKSRRRNNSSRLDATRGAIREVRNGEPYHLTLEQLSIAYTGTNQLESEYRGTRGLASFVSNVRELKTYFQNARQENWPDSE